MTNKTIDWWKPEFGDAEKTAIGQVFDAQYLNEGQWTRTFEEKLAEKLGVKYVVTTPNGTQALFLALYAMGIRPGDEVLVPDMTFIATAHAVLLAGAKPVLVDVDPRTLTLDPKQLDKHRSPKTRAIIPVHVSGRPAALESITEFARRYRLAVVEDAAEALMSCHKRKPLGTWGDVGCLSFSPNKIISTGQGGAVITDNPDIYARLKFLKDQGRETPGTGGDDLHPHIGFNFKFTNLQAAVGLGQLDYLDKRLAHIREIYLQYQKNLQGFSHLQIMPFDLEAGETPLWVDALTQNRDALEKHLKNIGINCRNFWHPLHTQKSFKLPDTQFPIATSKAREAIWLPSAFHLTLDDIDHVCEEILNFFR